MRKILGACLIMGNLFAVPPCEQEQVKVCPYLYKGAMSSEANIINMTEKKILVQGKIILDNRYVEIKDYIIEPNQTITIMKSKYDDPHQKPSFGWENFSYKFVN